MINPSQVAIADYFTRSDDLVAVLAAPAIALVWYAANAYE